MKDIKGYEGLYAVTSCGRVWSCRQNRFLIPINQNCGYRSVTLCKNGIRKPTLVHRLVAMAYIPNYENKPQVNHKDEDKTNNCVNNLEWCDAKYNTTYGKAQERLTAKKIKTVLCVESGVRYSSVKQAAKITNTNGSNIVQCLKGKRKTAGGYCWQYV